MRDEHKGHVALSLCEDRKGWPCITSLVTSVLAGQVQVQLGGRETAGIMAHLGFSTGKPSGPVKCKW